MLVFAVAVVAVWGLAATLGAGFQRAGIAARQAEESSRFDGALRRSVRRVRPAFWASGAGLEIPPVADDAAWNLPWLDGSADRSLLISYRNRSLSVDDGATRYGIDGVDSLEISSLSAEDGAFAGVSLSYVRGGRRYVCDALLGSFSLVGGTE